MDILAELTHTNSSQNSSAETLGSRGRALLQWHDAWMQDCEEARHCDLGDALTALDEFKQLAIALLEQYTQEEL